MKLHIPVMALILAGCPPKVPVESAGAGGAEVPTQPAVTPVLTSKAPVHERINEAVDLIEKGGPADLQQAITVLEDVATSDSTGTARFNLGVAYQARGDFNQAANQYQAVIAANPTMGAAWMYLGSVQERQGTVDSAVTTYRSGIKNDPEFIALRVALIAALRGQGKADEAIAESKLALKVNAHSLEVYNNFALAYLDKGDTTLSRFILQKALQSIDHADDNAYLHTNLGWSLYLDDNIPAATQELERAVELDPELVPALVYLARVYMDDRNFGDTVDLLETAADVSPDNADVQLTLGVAYRGVGRFEDAQKAYERALVLSPGNPNPHLNLGILLGDYQKDYEGAVAAFTQYIASGGAERATAEEYIKDVRKEQERADKRAKADVERKKREEERKRKDEVLRQAEEDAARKAAEPAPEPEPEPELELEPELEPEPEAETPPGDGEIPTDAPPPDPQPSEDGPPAPGEE